MKKEGKRTLKVYQKFSPRCNNKFIELPEIRLFGKWVKKLGFECGNSITIFNEENLIIIKKASSPLIVRL